MQNCLRPGLSFTFGTAARRSIFQEYLLKTAAPSSSAAQKATAGVTSSHACGFFENSARALARRISRSMPIPQRAPASWATATATRWRSIPSSFLLLFPAPPPRRHLMRRTVVSFPKRQNQFQGRRRSVQGTGRRFRVAAERCREAFGFRRGRHARDSKIWKF